MLRPPGPVSREWESSSPPRRPLVPPMCHGTVPSRSHGPRRPGSRPSLAVPPKTGRWSLELRSPKRSSQAASIWPGRTPRGAMAPSSPGGNPRQRCRRGRRFNWISRTCLRRSGPSLTLSLPRSRPVLHSFLNFLRRGRSQRRRWCVPWLGRSACNPFPVAGGAGARHTPSGRRLRRWPSDRSRVDRPTSGIWWKWPWGRVRHPRQTRRNLTRFARWEARAALLRNWSFLTSATPMFLASRRKFMTHQGKSSISSPSAWKKSIRQPCSPEPLTRLTRLTRLTQAAPLTMTKGGVRSGRLRIRRLPSR